VIYLHHRVSVLKLKIGIRETLRKGINLVGFDFPDLPILIKPNMCTETDIYGAANTDIQVIKALTDTILEENPESKVIIIESNSAGKNIENAFNHLGYFKLEKKYQNLGYDLSLVNLSEKPKTSIYFDGLYFDKLELPAILTKPKFFISVAKAKTHSLTFITGVLKNQFGCLPEKDKTRYHRYIDKVIVDLNRILQPDMCVVDALVGLEGRTGRPIKIGALIFGREPASVDAILTRVMGFNPRRVKHILLAAKYGLGVLDPEVIGNPIESVAVNFRNPITFADILGRRLPETLRPLARRIYRKVT